MTGPISPLRRAATALAVVLATLVLASGTPPPDPIPLVVIETGLGDITVGLRIHEAPGTVCNFLRYVETHAYDGGQFFRAVVAETNDNPNPIDVIQAATPNGDDDPGLGPISLEPTRDTGLKHVAGTISMARDGPDTATSSFFLVVKDAPALDYGGLRNPDGQGFAAFGGVAGGMDVVRAIQALPARDEQILEPVRIRSIRLMTEAPRECRR
ncbi:MAG TPA: peptidylprolyl isomerase [Caulobacter sp.]|nr:peptidylprolyl isomerase [Caulobacter sp.]